VLVTAHIAGDYPNPWHDVIDDRAGTIRYWGDAKHSDREKLCDAFPGNRCLKAIYDELLVGDRSLLPPILHFSRPSTGQLLFNGLCALETMDLTWFEDRGRPIRNYRYGLSILDNEFAAWADRSDSTSSRTALFSPQACFRKTLRCSGACSNAAANKSLTLLHCSRFTFALPLNLTG
jgi:hypothetical protein